jgi:hypothetical protein
MDTQLYIDPKWFTPGLPAPFEVPLSTEDYCLSLPPMLFPELHSPLRIDSRGFFWETAPENSPHKMLLRPVSLLLYGMYQGRKIGVYIVDGKLKDIDEVDPVSLKNREGNLWRGIEVQDPKIYYGEWKYRLDRYRELPHLTFVLLTEDKIFMKMYVAGRLPATISPSQPNSIHIHLDKYGHADEYLLPGLDDFLLETMTQVSHERYLLTFTKIPDKSE